MRWPSQPQPSSSSPWMTIDPPTQSMAAVPTVDRTDMSFGIATTSPRPMARVSPSPPRFARKSPMSSIFTISATVP